MVGEVPDARGGVVGRGVGVAGDGGDGRDLPARHHAVARVVARAHVVVVGQLHLVVVVVEAVEVLVGALQRQARGGDSGPCGLGLSAGGLRAADGHRQRAAHLAAVVAAHGGAVGGVGKVGVDDGGVVALRLQYGVGLGVGDGAVGGLEHPFEHQVGVGHIAGDVEGRQLLVAVEQQAVELVAFQVFLLDGQGAVVLVVADGRGLQLVVGVVVEGVEATVVEVGDIGAAEDGRDGGAAGDVAVEHAVHHHGVDAGGGGGGIVVAHDAADVGAASDGGEAVAVDHAGGAVEQAHQAAGVAGAAHRAAEDAHVVDARQKYKHHEIRLLAL